MFERPHTFLDLDQLAGYERLDLIAKEIVAGFMVGLHKSPYRGFSAEYAEHRLYNPGESTRYIDWKVYAKTERLYAKSFQEETNLYAYLAIDTSSSMYYPAPRNDKIRFATYAAAALAHLFHRQRDGVGLFSFSDHLNELPSLSSTTHLNRVLSTLQSIIHSSNRNKKTQLSKYLHQIADKTPRRSLIVVFSDFFIDEPLDELMTALQHLRHQGHVVMLFHIRDRQTESEFNFEKRPYVFYHLEGKEKLRLHPEDLQKDYQRYVVQQEEELYKQSGTLGVFLSFVDTKENFNRILLNCLMKRRQM